MSIFKKLILIIALSQFSCTLNKIDKVHGVSNLKNKVKTIKILKSNKNDVTTILGPSIIKSNNNYQWSYFEVRETRTKLGKKKIYLNDYVEINFNQYALVKSINIYDLNNLKNIKFAEEKTKSLGVEDNFFKNLLSSTRKRMEKAREKYK